MMQSRRLLGKLAGAISVGVLFCTAAMADTSTIFTFTTAANATNSQGNPVDAKAQITVSTNDIHIVLTNLLNNPTTVAQALSFLFFQIDNGTTGGTMTSSSAMTRPVKTNGT